MGQRGRPKIEIDKTEFEKLCGLFCTLDEIAGWFHCSPDTIENWCKRTYGIIFSEVFKKFSAIGKISLRRAQFQLAQHNTSMAIFLGKNYLGQTDRTEIVDNSATERLDEILAEMKASADVEA